MGLISSMGKLRAMLNANTGPQYKSRLRQLHEMVQIGVRHQLFPSEYFLYRFSEKDKDYRYMLQFMPVRGHFNIHLPALRDREWVALLGNKWFFHLHYGSLGVPLPAVHGYYDDRAGFDLEGRPLTNAQELERLLLERRPPSLVIKPAGGTQGRGVLILDEIGYEGGQIAGVTITGERMSFPEIAAHVRTDQKLRFSGYLLQERVQQHAWMMELNPYTVNSIRVVTFLDVSGEVDVHLAALRLGRKGGVVDNWDQRGISVGIDVVTGTLSNQGLTKPKYGGEWFDRHPDTGVPFAGRTIPDWAEVVRSCKHAAKITPNIRSIGWDVVIAPDGPVIIEGNYDWGVPLVQVHSDGYLQPRIREQLSRYGLHFPIDRLPSPSARQWWKLIRE